MGEILRFAGDAIVKGYPQSAVIALRGPKGPRYILDSARADGVGMIRQKGGG